MDTLIDKVRNGDRRSLAKAMSLVDRAGPQARALADRLRQSTGQVPWWGFTGPPGVGKSTLIDALLNMLRERGRRIGVVAVDPTSPMSDGALLGDRVRMMRHAVDQDVFIRSLATHHREGGLSDAALHCARLLELAGYDPVLIETVGVGQSEVDIASVADICVVMLGPGYGDDIQLIKAGLLEIADIVVVNKCDQPEANRLLKEIREELGEAKRRNVETPKRQNAKTPTAEHKTADGIGGPETLKRRNVVSSIALGGSHGFEAPPIEIVGIEAKSGRGVDTLLDKLLELDRAARRPDQCQHHNRRRLMGEISRGVMLTCEQNLNRALAAPATEELLTKLERGELSLDTVVAQLGVAFKP